MSHGGVALFGKGMAIACTARLALPHPGKLWWLTYG